MWLHVCDANSGQGPIGIFDSGIGGLSVLREIVRQAPHESTVYVADQVHIPYGPKPRETLIAYSEGIVRFLLAQRCKAIVVACHSASAAALKHLRARFPGTPFVGMEPAVKPAAAQTRTRTIIVLATPATLQGDLFAATAGRHAQGVRVIAQPCPGLVAEIEAGRVRGPEMESMLRSFLTPGLSAGADHVVLACTHYPFVIETIRRIVGDGVTVIDPAPAIAQQLGRVLAAQALEAASTTMPSRAFFTTGAVAPFVHLAQELVGAPTRAQSLRWTDDGSLVLPA